MKFQHMPAPWPETEPDPQPELRAEFEAMGFRLLGAAVRVHPTDAQVDKLAAGYVGSDREAFLAWAPHPNQVLAAPDGTAFVRLGWFWWGRCAEVSTVLPDARLVTTMTGWGIDPPWPRQIRRWYAGTTDRIREQLLWMSPSSSAIIVNGTAEDVWNAHRAQVASLRAEGAPPAHESLKDAVALFDAAQASRMRSDRRAHVWSAVILLPALLATFVAVNLLVRPDVVGAVALALAGAMVWVAAVKQVWLRARHLGWLRARLRAPVPRAGN